MKMKIQVKSVELKKIYKVYKRYIQAIILVSITEVPICIKTRS